MEPIRVTYEVVGMRKEFTVHRDKDLEYNDVYDVRPICTLFVRPTSENSEMFSLSIQLDDYNGPCGSGYCMASWGCMTVEQCNFNEAVPFTHLPKQKTRFDAMYSIKESEIILTAVDEDLDKGWEYFGNVFEFSSEGNDPYYPSGGYSINEDLFRALPRFSNRRMVWVFIGESGLGKSTIASNYPYGVFETDDHNQLPDKIYDNIIVVGNRFHYDVLSDIFPRIYQEDKPKVIGVNFYQSSP